MWKKLLNYKSIGDGCCEKQLHQLSLDAVDHCKVSEPKIVELFDEHTFILRNSFPVVARDQIDLGLEHCLVKLIQCEPIDFEKSLRIFDKLLVSNNLLVKLIAACEERYQCLAKIFDSLHCYDVQLPTLNHSKSTPRDRIMMRLV